MGEALALLAGRVGVDAVDVFEAVGDGTRVGVGRVAVAPADAVGTTLDATGDPLGVTEAGSLAVDRAEGDAHAAAVARANSTPTTGATCRLDLTPPMVHPRAGSEEDM